MYWQRFKDYILILHKMILRFVVTTKCCSLSLHISLCGGTCAAVWQSAVHRPGPATMALFRSDILNQELFRRAVQAAERTASVEILELTIGEARTGLQVSEATCRVSSAACRRRWRPCTSRPRCAGGGGSSAGLRRSPPRPRPPPRWGTS